MRKKTKIILGVSAATVVVVSAIGLVIWRISSKTTPRVALAASAPSADTSPSTISAGDNNGGLGAGTELASGNSQSQAGAPVATGSGSGAASSSTAPAIPGPEAFKQYEQYKDSKSAMFMDLQVGSGTELTAGKKAAVIYKVWLTNGTLIDQSGLDKPGGKLQPLVFALGDHSLIPGWEQGVFGMKVNGIRRMVIPAPLAYGAQGKDGVPPNSMLIIDVQLLQVQ